MSDALDPGLLSRLRATPLRDIVRGRITGRLDVRRHVVASGLPQPAQDLVLRVVRATRLWRIEQIEVADELISHFHEGLEAGESVEALVQSFGDERTAARLIRRSKKRNRSLAWHVLRGIGWFIAALVVLYIGLTIVFYTGSPSINTNYNDVLNADVVTVPEEDRAWPIYRQALFRFQEWQRNPDLKSLDAKPGDEEWAATVAWLERYSDMIELTRRAAAKPALGFVYGPRGSAYDPALFPALVQTTEENPPLVALLLPHLGSMRSLANAMRADARLAQENRDAERFIADIDALLNMAGHVRKSSFLVADLLAIGFTSLAYAQIESVLVNDPQMLADADVQHLAHRIADLDRGSDLLNYAGERMLFHDIVQRMYTDDGKGGGRMTPEGLRFFRQMSAGASPSDDLSHMDDTTLTVVGPASLALIASREELVREHERWIDRFEANLGQPLHNSQDAQLAAELDEWKMSWTVQARYAPLAVLMPALHRLRLTAERSLGARDGLLVALALKLYHRRQGSYPTSLDALTPDLLPSVPLDRITGEPLRYRLVDGLPLIYSRGADRDDDGGRVPTTDGGHPRINDVMSTSAVDGDWPLFPEPASPDPVN